MQYHVAVNTKLKKRKKKGGVVTDQTLVAVAPSDVSFARTIPADLIARSSHHDDATRVAVASC